MIIRSELKFFQRSSLQPRPSGKRPRISRLLLSVISAVTFGWLLLRLAGQPAWIHNLPPLLIEFIQLLEIAGLLTLTLVWGVLWWRRYHQPTGPLPALNIDALFALGPYEFERYVAELFRRKGYHVQLRGRSGDHGVDLMLTQPNGKQAVVQCKRYRKTIGPEIVRELYGTLIHERVAHAFLVTTAGISRSGRQWAKGKPITLIDGRTLAAIAAALDHFPTTSDE